MSNQDHYYQTHIFACNNLRPPGAPRGCCKDKNADDLRNYMRARVKEEGIEGVRVNVAGCLDRCELGPVLVIYPEGTWYTFATRDDVDEIVMKHLKGGEKVERLILRKDQKVLDEAQKPA